MGEDYVGIFGGKMKFIDTKKTGNGEGKPLCTKKVKKITEHYF